MGTQLAAIVVTDLVGSTELRSRIGEDAAEALRRDHDRLLAGAVTDAGGVVVKGLGDGILARFGGAAEAVEAAIAIQRAAAALGHDHGPVALRVGVAVGDVTVEDGDVFGTPVIEASRLCAAADGGRILVADLVRVLSHGRGNHTFDDRGPMELKGLPAPVHAAELRWEPAVATGAALAVPLPSPLDADGLPFAGRVAAVQTLTTRWKAACVGRRQVVLVSGEPGIGKTRLVSELARSVVDEEGVVLLGRCFEDLQAPYAPFVEALGHLVTHAPDRLLAEHVEAAGGDLARLVPAVARRIPNVPPPVTGDPELERLRLYESVVDLLARASDAAPVLLVLDDLHWADASSVGLLLWLVRSSRPMRLAVAGSYRDTDVDRTHPFGRALADLRRAPDVERISLGGLDASELLHLLERAGGDGSDENTQRLAGVLEAETEGNPFFVGEVLRHLVESGAIYYDGKGWAGDPSVVESSVPEGVRDVVGRRLSALGDDVNEALRAASVLGTEFDLRVLSRLVDRPVDELVDLLVEPCLRRLVSETDRVDRYRFAHALIRQTLSEELPAGRRARLHRSAGEATEKLLPTAHAEIARHYVAAGPLGDPSRAVEHATRAAEVAAEQKAWEDAAAWYERALDLCELVAEPDPLQRARLLLALGQTKNAMGLEAVARTEISEAADLAREAGDVELLAEVACSYGGVIGAWVDVADRHGAELLDEALDRLPPEPSPLRAAALAQRALCEVWAQDLEPGVRFADEAEAVARAAADDEALLGALRAKASLAVWLVQDEELRACVDEMEQLARQLGNVSVLSNVLLHRLHTHVHAGDMRRMADVGKEAYQFASEVGAASNRFFAGADLNLLRIAAGRFDEAVAYLDSSEREGWGAAEEITVAAQRLWIANLRDDVASYEEHPVHRQDWHGGFLHIFPATALGLQPPAERVREALVDWESRVRPFVPGVFAPVADAYACSVLAAAPVPEIGERCYRSLTPWADRWPFTPGRLYGSGNHLLGLAAGAAGRLDRALDHLRLGLDQHEAAGFPLFLADSHLELARHLLRRDGAGDVLEARRHLDHAREIADERGFRAAVRMADQLAGS